MIEVGSKVKDKIDGSIGQVIEVMTMADGHSVRLKYLIECQGQRRWRENKDLMEYLTNDGTQSSGQFMTEG